MNQTEDPDLLQSSGPVPDKGCCVEAVVLRHFGPVLTTLNSKRQLRGRQTDFKSIGNNLRDQLQNIELSTCDIQLTHYKSASMQIKLQDLRIQPALVPSASYTRPAEQS